MPVLNLLKNKQILLSPKPYILNEVVVKPSKNNEIEIGYSKSRSNCGFGTDIIGTEITSFINSDDIKNAYINFIILKFKKITKNTLVRVHLYQNEQGNPGTEIYIKNNLITVYEKDELKFNIINQHIKLPADGVFVSLEWIGNHKVKGDIYNETEFRSSPRVKGKWVNEKSNRIGFYRTYGKWETLVGTLQNKNKVYLPLFGLIVQEQK